ncbi:uncharacterized protein Z518_01811 [Rhinocladiella mackenziei CBS 650.93]|uniref:Dihydrodipicolinate synthase family protein n=1 Tax=Rhinocladiella mackenziei CBS 650.93 TaxID=1442369 RepID=A0A0D2H9I7_9EURO|nr:uncharacterized protein Z518_01811 [Rhinocladiella mackenziei CBS 650.93]KIX07158.1 hypothetical protein Z518_01811 [Rhinocladiella mackenziei CBS 650.93]
MISKKIDSDLQGLTPSPVTPFNLDGGVDYAAIQRLGSRLDSIESVKHIVILGQRPEEQVSVITDITAEGTEVAALEAKFAEAVGDSAGLPISLYG